MKKLFLAMYGVMLASIVVLFPLKSSFAANPGLDGKKHERAVSLSGTVTLPADQKGYMVFSDSGSASNQQVVDSQNNAATYGIVYQVCIDSGAPGSVVSVWDSSQTAIGTIDLAGNSVVLSTNATTGVEVARLRVVGLPTDANSTKCTGPLNAQFNKGLVVGASANSLGTVYWSPSGGQRQ